MLRQGHLPTGKRACATLEPIILGERIDQPDVDLEPANPSYAGPDAASGCLRTRLIAPKWVGEIFLNRHRAVDVPRPESTPPAPYQRLTPDESAAVEERAQGKRCLPVLSGEAGFDREHASMVEVVGRSKLPNIRFSWPFLILLASPLVLVACSKVTTASNPPQTTAPATVHTPLPSGPPNTDAAAAPTNAKYACEYLTAAIDRLSSDNRSVDHAVASVQSGVDSALAASVNDPSYAKLKADAMTFLEDVVRFQVQRQVSGRTIDASKYPTSYRATVKEIKADCR